MSSHRRLFPVVAALAAVILLSTPTLAAKWDFAFTQSGVSGSAQAEFVCTDNEDGTETCSSSGIFVFVGRSKAMGGSSEHVAEVCYSAFTDTFNPETGEFFESIGVFGCVRDAGDTLTIDDLSSITLEATDIPLTEVVCDAEFECTEEPGGTAVVAGEWTGFGPIFSQKNKSTFDDGICISVNSQKGDFRQADFTGTVDGNSFVAEFADLSDGTFTFRDGCEEE